MSPKVYPLKPLILTWLGTIAFLAGSLHLPAQYQQKLATEALEFNGLYKLPGDAYKFRISNKETHYEKWLKVGQRTGEYKLSEFQKKKKSIALVFKKKDGQITTIELSESDYNGPSLKHEKEYESTQLRFRDGLYYAVGEEQPITGIVTKKYPTGKQWYIRGYKDGKKHGTTTEWFPNGQKKYEMLYEDNKRTGIWTYWDQNGKVTSKREYENNQFKRNLPLK